MATVKLRGLGRMMLGTTVAMACSTSPTRFSAVVSNFFRRGRLRVTVRTKSRTALRLCSLSDSTVSWLRIDIAPLLLTIPSNACTIFLNACFNSTHAIGAVQEERIASRATVRLSKQNVAQSGVIDVAQRQCGVTKLYRPVGADPDHFIGITR